MTTNSDGMLVFGHVIGNEDTTQLFLVGNDWFDQDWWRPEVPLEDNISYRLLEQRNELHNTNELNLHTSVRNRLGLHIDFSGDSNEAQLLLGIVFTASEGSIIDLDLSQLARQRLDDTWDHKLRWALRTIGLQHRQPGWFLTSWSN